MPALNATTFDARLGEMQDVQTVALYRAFPLYLETFFFSLFIVLIVVSTYILIARQTRKAFVAVTLSMFILCSISWTIDIVVLWQELCVLLPARLSSPAISEEVSQQVYSLLGLLGYAQECCFLLNILLGDCVVLWRAYTLWGQPRWLLIVSCVLVFLSLVFDIFYLVVLAGADIPSSHIAFILATNGVLKLVAKGLAWTLTGIANILAIGLIGYKTWLHWKDVVAVVQGKSRSTLGMLSVLVETGILYLLAWSMSVLSGEFVFGTYPYYLNWYFVMPITGMYPTLVIVLVAGSNSLLEKGITRFRSTTGGTPQTATAVSMQFAAAPGQARTGDISTRGIDVSFSDAAYGGPGEVETPTDGESMVRSFNPEAKV